MADKITVTTTIKLPDGLVLSEDQIKSIQSIVDNGTVIPDPEPEIPNCKAAPKPLSVDVQAKNKLVVPWHGEGVEELDWFVKNISNGSVFDSGRIQPKASDNAKLTINLSRELTAKEYKIQLVATKCKGEGELVFANKFFEEDTDLKDCKVAPTTKSHTIVNPRLILAKWHGEDVFKLNWNVTDSTGASIGTADVEPKASDNATLTLKLNKDLVSGQKYTIVLSGISCKGASAYTFEVPKQGNSITVESIEVSK